MTRSPSDGSIRAFSSPMPDLNGAAILVTGGTGSFGRAFAKTVLKRFKPSRLVIFSRDELKQHEMQIDPDFSERDCVRFFIGDVRDQNRLEMAMRGIDYVIHAAALKQVPTAEYNPFECIRTNVIGAENVAQAAIRTHVKRVIALSTDKASNPINLYGASKLASDKIFVAANHLAGDQDTRFAVVRYGNVIGSRGSVVPFFNDLVAKGAKTVPITDPRMTRFWITLDQGVNFVLSSIELMTGGEIFVPKIPSMNVVDLARHIAPGVEHEVVGIRSGEKLHEVMITEDDARATLELDDRFVICPPNLAWNDRHLRARGAREVPESFRYGSDNNEEWTDDAMMEALLR